MEDTNIPAATPKIPYTARPTRIRIAIVIRMLFFIILSIENGDITCLP